MTESEFIRLVTKEVFNRERDLSDGFKYYSHHPEEVVAEIARDIWKYMEDIKEPLRRCF